MKRAPGSQVKDGGAQRVRDRAQHGREIPYGKTQTLADIHEGTAGVNGTDTYIEDPEAPPIKPDQVNSVPMSLNASEAGTGRG